MKRRELLTETPQCEIFIGYVVRATDEMIGDVLVTLDKTLNPVGEECGLAHPSYQ